MEVKIALIQMSCSEYIDENIDKAVAFVDEAAGSGANIVCLQELYASRYFPQTVSVKHYELARPLSDKSVEVMRKKAIEKKLVMVVPIFEMARPGVYFNTAVVVDTDGSINGTFRKIHIPEGPQYLEKYYFTPGNLGYPVFKTAYGTIGVGICWDEWFPEVPRILGLKGAEIIFFPSAIGSEPDHPEYSSQRAWETVITSHAITNGLFVAAINRVGIEDEMTFYGGSFISNPHGEVLAKGDNESDMVIPATLELKEIQKFRNLLQFYRDRRPDTYQELLKTLV
jgi:N-carbamoylputrescine amidase